MLKTGLVTVTFRRFDIPKICTVAQNAGLELLEWGGDVHVPPMDENAIRLAVSCSGEHQLTVDTYGSYYRCNEEAEQITAVVQTAADIGAKNLRVWAGTTGRLNADESTRAKVTANLRTVCDEAKKMGLTVSPEFHGGTLTDHWESALRLAHETDRDNLRLYWQPDQFRDEAYNLTALRAVLPYLSNVHVFTWVGHEKYPLADGEMLWRKYLDIIAADAVDHGLLLEFVCDDTEEQLYRDAETLHGWLR